MNPLNVSTPYSFRMPAFVLLASCVLIAGCGLGPANSTVSTASTSAPGTSTPATTTAVQGLNGLAFGGQNPVVGATIQLYQVGQGSVAGSYNANAIPLIATPVVTTAGGAFSITGNYTCAKGTYLYLTATGGNPGLGTGINPNLALMANVGLCDSIGPNTFINLNEVTTVAAAYAFAQFFRDSNFGSTYVNAPGDIAGSTTPAINVATSVGNLQGLANASGWANVLANPATGTSPGSNGNGAIKMPLILTVLAGQSSGSIAEFWQINTIANILAACVNSAGGVAGDGSACGTLFSNVVIPSGTNPATGNPYVAPVDTAQAAVYLALNPMVTTANIAALYGLTSALSPFLPYVTGAAYIQDFTVNVLLMPVVPGSVAPATTANSVLFQPVALSFDSMGNAWVSNLNGSAAPTSYQPFMTELSPLGVPIPAGTATPGATPASYQINTYNLGGTSTTAGGPYIYNTTTSGYTGLGTKVVPAIDTTNNVWGYDRRNAVAFYITGSGPKPYSATSSSSFAILSATESGNGTTGAYTYTTSAPESFYAGESVVVSGYLSPDTAFNQSGIVLASGLTSTTFSISAASTVVSASNTDAASVVGSTMYHNGGNANDAGGKGSVGYALPAGSAPVGQIVDGNNTVWTDMNGYYDPTTGVQTAGTSGACGSVYSAYNQGLLGFLNENPADAANIIYGGPTPTFNQTSALIDLQIDPVTSRDVTTASGATTPIPGSPFLWLNGPSSVISQYYTAAGGKNASGSTVSQGCTTVLSTLTSTPTSATTVLPNQLDTPTAGDTTSSLANGLFDFRFDGFGNIWTTHTSKIDTAGTINSSFTKITPSYGTAFTVAQATAAPNFSFSVYHGIAGINDLATAGTNPRLLAIDGLGSVWFTTANASGGLGAGINVGELSNNGVALSPTTPNTMFNVNSAGFEGSLCSQCVYNGGTKHDYSRLVAGAVPTFDLSGNAWILTSGTGALGINVTIGAAAPVVSPMSLGLKNGNALTRP